MTKGATITKAWPRSVGLTDQGRVRRANEDSLLRDDELGLWLVADGMGGHAGGARASQLAVAAVSEAVREGLGLTVAARRAHERIRGEQGRYPELSAMGTTLVAVREFGGECEICWTGDSRVYLYRGSEGGIRCLTRDHNVVRMLMDAGALSREEAARHPRRHVLTDCLGQPSEDPPRVDRLQLDWQLGDWLLLCTDGLTGELSDQDIQQVMEDHRDDMAAAAQALVDKALAAGGRDNVSVVLVAAPDMVSGEASLAGGWRRWFRRR